MACYKSRPAWQNQEGDPLQFTWRKDRQPEYFIDCGKCEGCRARQRQDWAIRLAHESKSFEQNSFVTLTYDDEHCPETIQRSDIQNFIKRLRKKIPVRYYVTGEYGDTTRRPHYHAIIFGADFLGGSYDINSKLYGNKILDNIWQQGATAISPFTFATAMYTAGYTAKKIHDPDTFSLQSRNPPIGKNWVRNHHDNIRRNSNVVIEGQEFPIPKVYLNWLQGAECFAHIKEELKNAVKPKNDKKLKAMQKNQQAKNNLRNHKL